MEDLERSNLLEPLLERIANKEDDPYSIVEKVVDHSFAIHLLDGMRNGKEKGTEKGKEKGKGR